MLYHRPVREDTVAEITPLSDPLAITGFPGIGDEAKTRLGMRSVAGIRPFADGDTGLNDSGVAAVLASAPAPPFIPI